MSDFKEFKLAIKNQMDRMMSGELYKSDADKEGMKETYLSSFREGDNPIYLERTEHDCNCCNQFLRAGGDILAIIDGVIVSIWDVELSEDSIYAPVAAAMSEYVKSKGIQNVYRHYQRDLGTDYNNVLGEDNSIKTWEHFHYKLPTQYVLPNHDIETHKASVLANVNGLHRGLDEVTLDALDIIIDIIEQDSLYKGIEYLDRVNAIRELKVAYDNTSNASIFMWESAIKIGDLSRFRNSVIGTLLTDVSTGVELGVAVKKFEDKVAPHNYKRSKPIEATAKQKEAAFNTVVGLGLESALHRRHATIDDISINNVKFAGDNAKKSMGVFDLLGTKAVKATPDLDKVEEVSIETFMKTILPKADSLELLVENSHVRNMMTLVAPTDPSAGRLFKWDNNFSWAYNGDMTDSMRERVVASGGRVDGVLRFTHSWNHTGQNQSLMDLHVFLPGHAHSTKKTHDTYGNSLRVGWNAGKHLPTGVVQDVDYTEAPGDSVPIENITFPDMDRLPEGEYVFKIHNWSRRPPCNTGFMAEIELNGTVYSYEYDKPLANKEWVIVARAVLKDGVFTIKHELPLSSKEAWGITTDTFQKVSVVMDSPNHWDGKEIGNKHWFFMLEDLKNPKPVRGFFNEYLRDELHNERKVFEVLGSKLKAEPSDKQLSGLGFSSTQRNHVLCKVRGSFNRTIKINF